VNFVSEDAIAKMATNRLF